MISLLPLLILAHGIPISYLPQTRIPPTERNFAVVDYLEAQDLLIAFSGELIDSSYTNDLWEFSLSGNYWNQLIPTSSDIPGTS